MSEENYIKLLIQKQIHQDHINRLSNRIEEITREMEHFDLEYWWKPHDMCHNVDECGDDCFNGCDMPKEMWEDRKKELIKKWG